MLWSEGRWAEVSLIKAWVLGSEVGLTEQFKEYLQYQPFKVKTDNNILTYIITIPNLHMVWHQMVAALAGYQPVIPVITFVLASDVHQPVYVSGRYGNLV